MMIEGIFNKILCMCVYIYIYIYIYICIHICAIPHAMSWSRIIVRTYACIYTHGLYIHVNIHATTYKHIYIHTTLHTCTPFCKFMYINYRRNVFWSLFIFTVYSMIFFSYGGVYDVATCIQCEHMAIHTYKHTYIHMAAILFVLSNKCVYIYTCILII
jgi:hypothetical protein